MLSKIHNSKRRRSLTQQSLKYKRIILKLTGEIFKDNGNPLSENAAVIATREIKSVRDLGVEVAVVLGGGNLFRGRNFRDARYIKSPTADYISMIATVQNGLVLRDVLRGHGIEVRLLNALETKNVSEGYIQGRAERHLQKGRVIILVGGMGSPNFTTDATAVQRAVDIEADAILKGTKVDGIYDKDPMKYPDAQFFEEISIDKMIIDRIAVVEEVALILNRDKKIPFHVFNIFTEGNLKKLLLGEKVGSRIIF